jgi:hypothetical protein
MTTRREYIGLMYERYKKLKRKKEKSLLIHEVVDVLKIHPKSVIRLLNTCPIEKRRTMRKRKYTYGLDLIAPLKLMWEIEGRACSKRLKSQIPSLLQKLKHFKEVSLYPGQEELLKKMSHWTIDQLLVEERDRLKGEGISGTKRSPLLKTLIPIRCDFDGVDRPGHLEGDCVLHCGESLVGTYAETVNMIDIYSHWNEKRMVLKKTQRKVLGVFHNSRKQFPFSILSIDFDNGGEFVNWGMYGYCKREGIAFTRSRSYHKNDQAHIEGKNYQSVRRVVGYERINNEKTVKALNDIYENEHRLLTNFFYPTLKLIKKTKVNGKYHKTYETPKTPYQRIMECGFVSKEVKDKLKAEYDKLNPALLHRSLTRKLERVKRYFR